MGGLVIVIGVFRFGGDFSGCVGLVGGIWKRLREVFSGEVSRVIVERGLVVLV